jgi:uncharacterized protein
MEKKTLLTTIVIAIASGIVLVVLGVLLGRSSMPAPTLVLTSDAGDAGNPVQFDNTVTFIGHGTVKAKPEIAHISFGIEICDVDASKANRIVNSRLITITQELQDAGLPADSIVPTKFSMYPRRSDYGADASVVGFCAENTLIVTTDKLDMVSHLLDVGIEAGATNVYDVAFTVKDTSNAKQEAISRAVADAQQQAERLFGLLNRPVAQIVKMNVSIYDNLTNYSTGYSGGGGGVVPQDGTMEANVTVVYSFPVK